MKLPGALYEDLFRANLEKAAQSELSALQAKLAELTMRADQAEVRLGAKRKVTGKL